MVECANCGKECDGSLYLANEQGERKNVCCLKCAWVILDIDDDLKLGYTLRKYDCPNCEEVNEIVILKKTLYKWRDEATGYLRTLDDNDTLEVRCAKCGEILIR